MKGFAMWVFDNEMRACMEDTPGNERFADELSLKIGFKNKKLTMKEYEDEYVKDKDIFK